MKFWGFGKSHLTPLTQVLHHGPKKPKKDGVEPRSKNLKRQLFLSTSTLPLRISKTGGENADM